MYDIPYIIYLIHKNQISKPELSTNITRPNPKLGQFHNPHPVEKKLMVFDISTGWHSPYLVGERSAIDEDSSQLIHFSVGVHVRLWGFGFEGTFKNILDIFQ